MSTDQISKHVPFRRSVPWSEAWSAPMCVDPSVHLGWSPPSSHRDPKQRPNLSCGLHWASSLPGGWDPPFGFVQKLSYPFHSNKLYIVISSIEMVQNDSKHCHFSLIQWLFWWIQPPLQPFIFFQARLWNFTPAVSSSLQVSSTSWTEKATWPKPSRLAALENLQRKRCLWAEQKGIPIKCPIQFRGWEK